MDYLKGSNLYHYIKPKRRLDPAEAQRIFRQVVNAVDFCHDRSIAHRDIKLENIIINKEGTHITLIDFGFST